MNECARALFSNLPFGNDSMMRDSENEKAICYRVLSADIVGKTVFRFETCEEQHMYYYTTIDCITKTRQLTRATHCSLSRTKII